MVVDSHEGRELAQVHRGDIVRRPSVRTMGLRRPQVERCAEIGILSLIRSEVPPTPLERSSNTEAPQPRELLGREAPLPSGAFPVFGYGHRPCPIRRIDGLRAAAFFDLDRTLLSGGSGMVFSEAMRSAGLITRALPGERMVYGLFSRVGENLLA